MNTKLHQGIRSFAVPFIAWAGLATCTLLVRLFVAGPGTRTMPELVLISFCVTAYWLIAGSGLLLLQRRSLPHLRRGWRLLVLLLLGALLPAGDGLWYRVVLTAFHGRPASLGRTIAERANVDLLIVALVLAVGWLENAILSALERARQQRELEAVLVDTELRALALQLQPHFLFNTLQLAAEAAHEDMRVAKSVVRDLRKLLRRALQFENDRFVRVAQEVDFLRSYVAIQQRRFGSRLSVELDVAPDTANLLIPPLLLQPLVENSIRHGIGPRACGGIVAVRVLRDLNHLSVEVRDNGIGFQGDSVSATNGLGLGVTRRRLSALFPNDHELRVEAVRPGGASVTIVLPIHDRPNAGDNAASAPARELRRPGHSRDAMHATLYSTSLAVAAAAALLLAANAASFPVMARTTPHMTLAAHIKWLAMWVPAELLILALAPVLSRVHHVRVWLEQRNTATRALRAEITNARAQMSALHASRDAMVAALNLVSAVRTAAEFDDMIVRISRMMRGQLAQVPLNAGEGKTKIKVTGRSLSRA